MGRKKRRRYRRGKGVRVRHCEVIRELNRLGDVGQLAHQKHVDLHGLRVVEAETVLKSALKSALISGEGQVLVNHGRGSGTLRSFVRGDGAALCKAVTGARGVVEKHWDDPKGWSVIRFRMEATRPQDGVRVVPPPEFPSDNPYVDLRELYLVNAKLKLKAALSDAAKSGKAELLVLLGIPKSKSAKFCSAVIIRKLGKIIRECLGRTATIRDFGEDFPGWIHIRLGERIA